MPVGTVSAAGIMVTVYISEALLSSPTSAKMTASIVASEGTTDISQDTDLLKEDIIDCAKTGYELGFRTFVLQGGEDMHYTRQDIALLDTLKSNHPDCAVTLSIGERSREDYKVWYDAGADRYLLRHETADKTHYARLHPESMSFDNRMRCLYELKSIGYQTGCGFMVGSPYQTIDHLVREMRFLKEFQPDMVGIGPFIPHHETPFKNERQGTLSSP